MGNRETKIQPYMIIKLFPGNIYETYLLFLSHRTMTTIRPTIRRATTAMITPAITALLLLLLMWGAAVVGGWVVTTLLQANRHTQDTSTSRQNSTRLLYSWKWCQSFIALNYIMLWQRFMLHFVSKGRPWTPTVQTDKQTTTHDNGININQCTYTMYV